MVGTPEQEERPTGARELARQAMRAQVAEMALDLFLEKGYDRTTVDDICAVAGISRSTFFRYFPAKEDVFASRNAGAGGELLDALRRRPEDEAPWTALGHAMEPLVASYSAGSERALRLAVLARATPALAARHQEKMGRLLDLLVPEIARRLGADPLDATDPRPRALTSAAIGCIEAAVAAWIAGGGTRRLGPLLRRAMASVAGEAP
ncbi:putative TetR family transcriptional regulator [Actinacidiphila reveromycinica]|uniref:Putative TetR family transcriptional regulator n=1 Tax=Actinacidiphila reveromycinica TaxID=659352 RepID=A0A7U3VMZ6_9ACTN|nr:TetR family transcriptional regulator [Streptomyces sp. SN-593]BBA97069.1 putative TetR family transcriptional regulator [Streptomyces sp. SN-593]